MQLSSNLRQKVKSILLSRNNFIRAAFLFSFASLASWMPMLNLWLETKGLTGVQIGMVAAIPWLLMLFIQPFWGVLADRYGKLVCFRISLIGASVLFLAFPFASTSIGLIAFMTVALSLFNTPVLPLLDSIALDHVESRKINSYSTIRFWGALGYALGASLTGWLIPILELKLPLFQVQVFYCSLIYRLLK
ncbi:MAG: MFS transporter [Bacteroidetes bacterium]|nr:MFS transporter [Bacteroidota bacterium]